MLAYVRVTRAGEEGPLTIFVDTGEGAAHAASTAKALAREQGLRLEGEAWAHGVSFFGVGEGGGRTLLVWLGLGPGVPEGERRAR